MELTWLTAGDADIVAAAGALFDDEPGPAWTQRFLDEPSHHLCIAMVDAEPAGFVSGIEITHPDKGTEMLLYELGVDDRFQRRGIGTALVRALEQLARSRGCYGMWVLTDATNEAAMRTYAAGGADDRDEQTMLTWRLDPGHRSFEGAG